MGDWSRAKRAATRICDENYSCKAFHDDVVGAFPELRLYVSANETSSGRASSDEFQRTVGALYAIYWLMRGHLDGIDCFTYGLRSDMINARKDLTEFPEHGEFDKRHTFRKENDWARLEALFVDAGLKKDGLPDPDRTLAMLVLMAIHDIMKGTSLLPTVEAEVGPFHGYKVGDVISDHDVALSYILEHHPTWLPSFSGLSRHQQESIKFTHGKMDYNMGWLVQAEAPPGALFSNFRKLVVTGEAKPQVIAFYFVHWFADLAGAEPYPPEGCEKFVLKFPLKVLKQFVQSFSIVQTLGEAPETEVYENYLVWRWTNHDPPLGDVPTSSAIAKLRLVIMAQGDSLNLLKAFHEL